MTRRRPRARNDAAPKRPVAIPPPEDLRRQELRRLMSLAGGVGDHAAAIIEEYAWAYIYAYTPGSGSGEPVVAGGGPSDSTGNAAVDNRKGGWTTGGEGAREVLAEVVRYVREADGHAEKARKAVAAARATLRSKFGPPRPRGGMVERFPKIVTDDELASIRAARRRRDERGEGFGDA